MLAEPAPHVEVVEAHPIRPFLEGVEEQWINWLVGTQAGLLLGMGGASIDGALSGVLACRGSLTVRGGTTPLTRLRLGSEEPEQGIVVAQSETLHPRLDAVPIEGDVTGERRQRRGGRASSVSGELPEEGVGAEHRGPPAPGVAPDRPIGADDQDTPRVGIGLHEALDDRVGVGLRSAEQHPEVASPVLLGRLDGPSCAVADQPGGAAPVATPDEEANQPVEVDAREVGGKNALRVKHIGDIDDDHDVGG